jgi:hypothetical protein
MDELKSIYVEGFFHGREIPNKMTIKRPNLFRNDVKSGVLVFDGKRAAWAERKPDDEGNPRHPEMIDSAYWMHFEVDIAIAFPAYFDYPAEYKGITKISDKEAHELKVDLPLGSFVIYFIDTESFLVTRRLVSWEGNPEDDLWENLVTNYVDHNGFLFPDGYTFDGQEGQETGYYKNVKFNIDPKDELFEIPEELK